MIVYRPNVEFVELRRSDQPWNLPGVIAYGVARIDGEDIGPFFVVRTPTDCMIPHFGVCGDGKGLPTCLQNAETWEKLRIQFARAIQAVEDEAR